MLTVLVCELRAHWELRRVSTGEKRKTRVGNQQTSSAGCALSDLMEMGVGGEVRDPDSFHD